METYVTTDHHVCLARAMTILTPANLVHHIYRAILRDMSLTRARPRRLTIQRAKGAEQHRTIPNHAAQCCPFRPRPDGIPADVDGCACRAFVDGRIEEGSSWEWCERVGNGCGLLKTACSGSLYCLDLAALNRGSAALGRSSCCCSMALNDII